jgi:glycosyltransferase involved in cell wall biosynthesis
MKFFEYLSAGRPVVAANTPALEPYREACLLASSADAFVAAAEQILAGRGPDAGDCDALARKFTWDWRIREMLGRLEQVSRSRHPAAAPSRAA